MRDRAVPALPCLTGIRVGALTPPGIGHVELDERSVTQNPRGVAARFGGRTDTFSARDPVGAEAPLRVWMIHPEGAAPYGPDDPLFPATALTAKSNQGFTARGFTRAHRKTTEPVRGIVNAAFGAAGLPTHGPHAFRRTLARHAAGNGGTVGGFIANAQDPGHTDPLTALRGYGSAGTAGDARSPGRAVGGLRGSG